MEFLEFFKTFSKKQGDNFCPILNIYFYARATLLNSKKAVFIQLLKRKNWVPENIRPNLELLTLSDFAGKIAT